MGIAVAVRGVYFLQKQAQLECHAFIKDSDNPPALEVLFLQEALKPLWVFAFRT